VTTDLRRAARPVIANMERLGVLVRGVMDPGYESFLRVTVGLPEENARALAVLGAALAGV
jgi:histidinol-phosphate aminotransferase